MSVLPNSTEPLAKWIAHVFDHPVKKKAWHWKLGAPHWDEPPELTARLIAEAFERSGTLLDGFSGKQLNQGFNYILSSACSDMMCALTEAATPMELRVRGVRSFVPLFQQVMAVRCSQKLSHLDERGTKKLNRACYMWWDMDSFFAHPKDVEEAEFDAAVLDVFRGILRIPHDACRESALHGLGHWAKHYPQVAEIIEEFLDQNRDLRPKLAAYAQDAKLGYVL